MENKKINDLPDILTAQQIANYLSISRRRVYELFQTKPECGGIPNFEVGKSKRVAKDDFSRWIENKIKQKSMIAN
ncbi:helix-turn-helix domain-containing protein [Paenibacillus larvae]